MKKLIAVVMLFGCGAAQAELKTWTLNGIWDDGSELSGYFVMEHDDFTINKWDHSVGGACDSSTLGPIDSCLINNPAIHPYSMGYTAAGPKLGGGYYAGGNSTASWVLNLSAPLLSSGGVVNIASGEFGAGQGNITSTKQLVSGTVSSPRGNTSATAPLFARDLYITSDGLLTYDEQTNLEWLDWTATLGISAVDILSGSGGWIANGFRFATRQEIAALIQHGRMTVGYYPGSSGPREDEYRQGLALRNLLGITGGGCAYSKLPSVNGASLDIQSICLYNAAASATIFTDYITLPEPDFSINLYGSALVRANSISSDAFTPLGDLPGGVFSSGANGISADGSVVVGYGSDGSSFSKDAVRWDNGVIVRLSHLLDGTYPCQECLVAEAISVSDDGSVVVGDSTYSGNPDRVAARWADDGIQNLGLGPFVGDNSRAESVSGDGSIVVGTYYTYCGYLGFQWTNGIATTLEPLQRVITCGDPGNFTYPFSTTAYDVSADGSVVVGATSSANGWEAFLRANGIMTGLGDLPGGEFSSQATAVTPDGSVVIGWGTSSSGKEAFRWSSNQSMVSLGILPGKNSILPKDISADGAVVVGNTSNSQNYSGAREAFIWSPIFGGMQRLVDVLVDQGATGLNGWTLLEANGISDDGRVIVGTGINPAGQTEAFRATLSIPLTVKMDVDIFSVTNKIDPNVANRTISVAILGESTASGGTIDFDATQINATTLKFGIGEAPVIVGPYVYDANRDSMSDLVLGFRTYDSAIACGDTEVMLTGTTNDGAAFYATDSIETINCEAGTCHP